MLEQILKQLEKGIINWYGAKILIENLYKNNVVLDDVIKCECENKIYVPKTDKVECMDCGKILHDSF